MPKAICRANCYIVGLLDFKEIRYQIMSYPDIAFVWSLVGTHEFFVGLSGLMHLVRPLEILFSFYLFDEEESEAKFLSIPSKSNTHDMTFTS
jgi:hypothetical protein